MDIQPVHLGLYLAFTLGNRVTDSTSRHPEVLNLFIVKLRMNVFVDISAKWTKQSQRILELNKQELVCAVISIMANSSQQWLERDSTDLQLWGCSVCLREIRLQPAAGRSCCPHLPGEMQSSPRVRRLAGWQYVLRRQHERRRWLLPGLKYDRISVCLFFFCSLSLAPWL